MYCENCDENHCEEYVQNNSNGGLNLFLIILLIWALFFQKNKYDGLTAEEWADEYHQASWCIENAIDYVEDSPEDAYYYLSQCS